MRFLAKLQNVASVGAHDPWPYLGRVIQAPTPSTAFDDAVLMSRWTPGQDVTVSSSCSPRRATAPSRRSVISSRPPARSRVRLWVERSPFDRKDVLRGRGYKWNNGDDGRARSWWIQVVEDAVDEEVRFLREEIYRRPVDLPREIVTAHERYRAG